MEGLGIKLVTVIESILTVEYFAPTEQVTFLKMMTHSTSGHVLHVVFQLLVPPTKQQQQQ